MAYLLGIDIGTTNCKVVAYDLAGRRVAESIQPTLTHHPRPDWAEYQPGEIWDSVAGAISRVVAEIGDSKAIKAVAAGSMGEAGVALDRDGKWLYPIIAWFDPRTQPQSDWWASNFGAYEVFKITGLPLHPMYSLNKLMWLKENEPQVYKRIHKWLCMEDFIVYMLTGECVTDYSLASRTMGLNVAEQVWAAELFEAAGINPDIMPKLYASGTVVGEVTGGAAKLTGLAKGTPVVTGGHDHTCGALAVGVFAPWLLLDSTGTTEGLLISLDRPIISEEIFKCGYTYECHVAGAKYVLSGTILTSGVLVDWFKDLVGYDGYERLLREAEAAKAGASGLFLLPHFRGAGTPAYDPCSRGVLLGLLTSHSRGELARSILEGICYELKYNLDTLEELLGIEFTALRAIGGGVRSSFWLQLKADVTGKVVEVPDIYEGTCLGAALLGGIGVGIYEDERDAVGRVYRVKEKLAPRVGKVNLYQGYYQKIYRRIYSAVREINEEIHKMICG